MTATATEPITEITALGEGEVCHIATSATRGICGAPLDCAERDEPWTGQGQCPDCGRRICPECAQLESKEIEDHGEEWW